MQNCQTFLVVSQGCSKTIITFLTMINLTILDITNIIRKSGIFYKYVVLELFSTAKL